MNLHAILRIARRSNFPDIPRVLKAFAFVDEAFGEAPAMTADEVCDDLEHDSAATFPADEVQVLKDAGLCRKSTNITHMGRLFAVLEQAKEGKPANAEGECRRAILWPRNLNAKQTEVPTPTLEDTTEAAREVEPNTWATCFDLKNGFHQVPLSEARQSHFGFKINGETWVYIRLPMGTRFAPEVMQVVVEILAHAAVAMVTSVPEGGAVKARVHIDNVRFVSKAKSVVTAVAVAFQNLCREANITLNTEDENAVHQQGAFLGQICDYKNGKVSVAKRTMEKLSTAWERAQHPQATLRDVLSLYGSTLHCARILRSSPSSHYAAMKFCRKRVSALAQGEDLQKFLDKPANLWPCAQKDFQDWVIELKKNEPTNHLKKPDSVGEKIVMFVDASLIGWGAVLVLPDGSIFEAGGKWRDGPHLPAVINQLEMRSVANGCTYFGELIRRYGKDVPLVVFVDSSSTFFVLKKGSAREYLLNNDADDALSKLSACSGEQRYIEVRWISTVWNPADATSRGGSTDCKLVAAVMSSPAASSPVGPVGRCGVAAVRVPRAPRSLFRP
jgi:hypothetical protein